MNINDLAKPEETKRLYEQCFSYNIASGEGTEVSSHWQECLR